jgi:DNA polymerase-1
MALFTSNQNKVTLVDASGVLYRSVFSQQAQRTSTFSGQALAGPAFILFQSLLQISRNFSNVVYILDGYPISKMKLYPLYKAQRDAQRKKDPQHELRKEQRASLRQWIFLTVPTLVGFLPDQEADDCIGSLATQLIAKGTQVTLLSGDRDLWQLRSKGVRVFYPGESGGFEEVTDAQVEEKFGVPSSKISQLKSIDGDTSDNIPRVFRAPTKMTRALVNGTDNFEDMWGDKLDQFVDAKWKPKFEEFRKQAEINYQLANIDEGLRVKFGYFNPDITQLQGIFSAFSISHFSAQELYSSLENDRATALALLVQHGLLTQEDVLTYEDLTTKITVDTDSSTKESPLIGV